MCGLNVHDASVPIATHTHTHTHIHMSVTSDFLQYDFRMASLTEIREVAAD